MGFFDRPLLITSVALGAAMPLGSAACAQPTETSATQTLLPSNGVLLHKQTYFMPAGIEATWSAFTDPRKRKVWFGFGSDTAPAPSSTTSPPYVQRGVVDHPGLPGPTENTLSLAPTNGGTLVTQTIFGLGGKDVWHNSVDPGGGISEMMGDLALYLRTGTGFPRHTHVALRGKRSHPNDFLAGVRDYPGGVEILDVPPGTLGAQAGMQPGDILVAIGDTGIYNQRDLAVARLGLAAGDMVEVAWIRDAKVLRGTGRMTSTPTKWRNGFDPTKAIRDNEAAAKGAVSRTATGLR